MKKITDKTTQKPSAHKATTGKPAPRSKAPADKPASRSGATGKSASRSGAPTGPKGAKTGAEVSDRARPSRENSAGETPSPKRDARPEPGAFAAGKTRAKPPRHWEKPSASAPAEATGTPKKTAPRREAAPASKTPKEPLSRPKRADRPERTFVPGKVDPRERSLVEKRGPADIPSERQASLRSGQTVELDIVAISKDGFGIAQHEGTRVLVAGGLTGEKLVARVTYVGHRESFANTIRCLKSSADRNPNPACSLGKACDGCPLIRMRYPAQLAWKKKLVAGEFRAYPSLFETVIHDTLASPKELQYRNSGKLVVSGKHSDPKIGIYRRNSHEVMEITECPLHHPLINKVVQAVKAGIKKGKVPVYNPKSEMGLLRYLVVRVAEPAERAMVVFVTSEEGYNEIHHLAKAVQKAVPEVVVMAQNINGSSGNVIFGQKERFITKAHTLRATIGDKVFSLSPRSFFQVNGGAAGIIYEKVREFAQLKGTERVIDLYCGIGGIALYLAETAREVVGIEVVEAAVADATQNAALNGARNVTFEAGDAVALLDEIGAQGGAQLIVLNPPRKGCEEKVLQRAAALRPEKMIYVSCSPETLARDLDILSRLGYRTREVQPVDMFPQTVHVENVALLVRE